MGNYRFRFSDMIPNAWFHKLKNMHNKPTPNYTKTLNRSKKKHSSLNSPEFTNSDQRKSYYFTRDLTLVQPDSLSKPAKPPPRRSTKRSRPRQPRLVSSTVPAGCSCGAVAAKYVDDWSTTQECMNSGPDKSSWSEPDSILTEYGSDRGFGHNISMVSSTSPCKCGAANDIVIDIKSSDCGKGKGGDGSDDQCRRLPPIITKKNEAAETANPVRRLPPAKSPGMKLRVNSPRIANPRRAAQGRRSVSSNSSSSESFAVVKASKDPRRDFRESMVEMILENNIRASNDLEELLACYLSLNSDEYHDLIINVFKQIWFDHFIHLRLKIMERLEATTRTCSTDSDLINI